MTINLTQILQLSIHFEITVRENSQQVLMNALGSYLWIPIQSNNFISTYQS